MENKSLPSSTDEGFEDSRSGDFTKSPQLSQVPLIDLRKSKENPCEKVITFTQESIILNAVSKLMYHFGFYRVYKNFETEAKTYWR
jgi:ATP-dependent helicase YprA (DUF1998 family)